MGSKNKTISLATKEKRELKKRIRVATKKLKRSQILNQVFQGDTFKCLEYFPQKSVDLLFADPPYNLTKTFNQQKFKKLTKDSYVEWLDSWIKQIPPLLKDNAAIYICGDWRSSAAIETVCEKYFQIQNRITFAREKGRGSKRNWKNNSEDIWFCTVNKSDYTFNIDAIKTKKTVLAPYTKDSQPKDWVKTEKEKYRLTYPSNIWDDLTIPFWSMAENTPHPTQKPEKLLAKIVLASSNPGDLVFDPFLGSGTTAVVAQKLNRLFCGIEADEEYCYYALKRLSLAQINTSIQGYSGEYFLERNAR